MDESANKVDIGGDGAEVRTQDAPVAPAAGWFDGTDPKGEPPFGSAPAAAGPVFPPAAARPEVLAGPCTRDAAPDVAGPVGAVSPAEGNGPAAGGACTETAAPAAPASRETARPAHDSPAPAPKRGLAARLGALFGHRGQRPSATADSGSEPVGEVSPKAGEASAPATEADALPACTVLPDGAVVLPAGADALLETLPRFAGQAADVVYAVLPAGLPTPPGGGAYLLEIPASAKEGRPGAAEDPAASTVPAAPAASLAEPLAAADGPAGAPVSPEAPAPVIVAYIDSFGRVFSTGSVQSMPPARVPEVQLVRYAKPSPHTGCVEVAVSKVKTERLAEYDESPDGTFALTGSRADFGVETAGFSLSAACAAAFLVLWLFPHSEGVPLGSVNVKDVLAHLRAPNLFETIDLLVADARQSEAHPLLAPPGLITYTAYNLRAAGLEHLKATDLIPPKDLEGLEGLTPSMFLDGLPEVSSADQADGDGPATVVATAHVTVAPGADLLESIQRALEESGITGLAFMGGSGPHGEKVPAIPSVRLVRTSAYANLFYVVFDRRKVKAEGARKLLEAESILNRLVLMAEELDRVGAVQTATWGQVAELDAWLVDRVGSLADPYLDDAVAGVERAGTGSADLDVRLSFARGCEKLRLPFRLEYGFRFDASAGDLVVDVETPSSVLMPRVVWLGGDEGTGVDAPAPRADAAGASWRERTYAEREGMASRYALHLAGVVAAVGFWSGEQVERVTVNCWHGRGASEGVDGLAEDDFGLPRGGSDEPVCVGTVQFDRSSFARLLETPDQRAAFGDDPFRFVAELRHSYTLDGSWRLGRVQPLYALDDPRLHVQGPDVQPEFDGRALTERGRGLLRAANVDDLAIYENAARRQAANEVVEAFASGGKEAALAALKDVHDRTENLLVRDACARVRAGIEGGTYTADTKKELADALGDIYGLQAGSRAAYRMLHSDPATARRRAEAMLAAVDERVLFADTSTRRYRYFDSYAARVLYGVCCPEADDGRELRLCADEYYLCHYRLSALLADSLDDCEEAIAHARRCVELAPSVAASYLRLARCYFCVFDYLSEIDTLKQMLAVAWNPTDVGLALYWMAYAFCLVGKEDVGMVCYQRCIEYDRSLTEVAASEAVDFLQRRGERPRTYSDREAEALLAREGVDLDQVDRNAEFLMQAAGALVDVGSFGFARNLIGAAEAILRDDAIPPVTESLEE